MMRKTGKMKQAVCKLMVAGFLLTAGVSGVSGSAEAASGTWKHNKNGYWYEYSDGTYPKNQWLQIGKKWYHFDAKGFMQTGWQKIGGKWYYFGPKTGAMQTGWKTIGGKTYYLKADGSMAANEYCQGYWLNKDGTWTVKAKADWKKNSVGWWYEDTKGWCPKSQWLKIDGKDYYFLASGYMAVSRWIGKSYVGSDGVWVPGKKSINWTSLYKKFLEDKGYQTLGQGNDINAYSNASLYDIDRDGIPELLIDSFVYRCSSGKVEYVGKAEGSGWFYIKTKANPEGILCNAVWSGNVRKNYQYSLKGKTLSLKQISISDTTRTESLYRLYLDAMITELPSYSSLLEKEDPYLWTGDMKQFLDALTFTSHDFDYRSSDPFEINYLYWRTSYPTDPVTYSYDMGYRSGSYQNDPKGEFGTYFYKLDGKKADWILKNVYNCSASAISATKRTVAKNSGEMFPMYYQNGYYYTSPYGNFEGTYLISVQEVRSVNGLYVVKYCVNQYYMGEAYDKNVYYAVLGQKTVSGKTFWSMYINSDTKPSDSEVKAIKKVTPDKLP